MLKPIYVCWDQGLTSSEEDAIIKGLREMQPLLEGRQIVVYGNKAWSGGSYSSGQWYVDHARYIGAQLDAGSLLDLLANEPWQQRNPHIDLLFTSEDLTGAGLNFCFGMAQPHDGISVQSVARYRSLPSLSNRQLCIRRVLRHELGHILGMAQYGRPNTEEKLGSHCTNPGCTMRQGMDIYEWLSLAREEEWSERFCPQCMVELRRFNRREDSELNHRMHVLAINGIPVSRRRQMRILAVNGVSVQPPTP